MGTFMNNAELEFLYACRVINSIIVQIRTGRIAEMLCRIKNVSRDVDKEKIRAYESVMPDTLKFVEGHKLELRYNDEEIKVKITIEWE